MQGRILPRRACNSCGFTMKMSSMYHRLLIYEKRTTKIDGMGPFKGLAKRNLIFAFFHIQSSAKIPVGGVSL